MTRIKRVAVWLGLAGLGLTTLSAPSAPSAPSAQQPGLRATFGQIDGGWIGSVAFSPDGKTLASGSWDGTIKLWDVSGSRKPGE